MARKKIDTRGLGLDIGLTFSKWLTGAENLHYGYWDGLEVCAANFGVAQVAYTDLVFERLPKAPCRILDIGGGAGETARKLIAMGHQVEIVIPSAFLASRCRENAPEAVVHEATFQDAQPEGPFDVCLFSESFQYIPLDQGIAKCLSLLAPGGRIVIADCFRSEGFKSDTVQATVGGGHPILAFRDLVKSLKLQVSQEIDITAQVAPSIDLEQGLFNVVGYAGQRVDAEMAAHRPRVRSVLHWVWRRLMSQRKRARLDQRLNHKTRNAAHFSANNTYLMLVLTPA
ncbi:methyltransferase family protein [Yoonia maricola]|uniref:Methyltransferase family protein n=1 Tax=Yoonia maricola TaxID=420999 RepID=A0A2M8W2C2_9RHOB|nr:class I SAM-dependent methyltransferase [Yoonia maricola]PJI85075.1 methyltransferase family protein [Yoonia maricola]